MAYKFVERNYDGIEFEALRREVDGRFIAFHDALSAAYYDGGTISSDLLVDLGRKSKTLNFGTLKANNPVLAKEIFDLLHSAQEIMRQVVFHETNKAKPVEQQIAESLYNTVKEGMTETPYNLNKAQLLQIKAALSTK